MFIGYWAFKKIKLGAFIFGGWLAHSIILLVYIFINDKVENPIVSIFI